MSTRHSTRTSRPTLKALESSSPPNPSTTAKNTPRSTRSAGGGAEKNPDESPVAKRRRISPEEDGNAIEAGAKSTRKRAPAPGSASKAKSISKRKDQEATSRPRRRKGKGQAESSVDDEDEDESIAPPSSIKVNGSKSPLKLPNQKITNLYGGRRKHVDRDDTPSTVSSRNGAYGHHNDEVSPVKSARKKNDSEDDGVDKFRRGRHGSVKKKVLKPTIVVNGAEEDAGRGSPVKRGKKIAEDTDMEGDVIMVDSDISPTKKSPSKLGVSSALKSVGRKKVNRASPASTSSKKDDESSIYDFPGSDEEDVFKPKMKRTGKTPSKFTASLRKAAKDDDVSSSGIIADDEAVEETAEEELVVEKPKPRTKFTGRVTDEAVKLLKYSVMKKVTGRGLPDKLVGLKDEYAVVHQLLEQTVVAGEGNSILLIGPRGSGKSLVTEKAISELQKHYEGDFIVVRLSGCLQTDERTAVKEIWRQLGSSMDMDDSKPINFADTLTTILALLSHPSEHDPNATSMNETTSISVLFLLSEFEQFAAHPRQTLLYNLFDIAQARKAPIAVVGMTSKINIVEDLEKRVKSRFSHRTLGFRIGGHQGSRLEGWWEVAKAGLCMDIDTLPMETGKSELAYYSHWNTSLDDAFKSDKAFRRTVDGVFSTSKNIQVLYNHLMVPICNISVENPFLSSGETLLKTALVAPDNKLYLLEDLPELSLALLIAAARLDPILETDTCNFTMAYDEYKTLVSRVKIYSQTTWGLKLWGKDVALAAWEKLAEWELIVPVVGSGAYGGVGVTSSLLVGSGNTGVGRRESRMFRVDVGLLEIKRQGRSWGMSSILQGWCTIG
ncbi:hypothetical protein ABW19_dt0203504 [Dactylella cylindrospora]|nr:hypothetical protein ABW19_dt0203504 [Dactylella cylindrospora]